MSGLPRFEYEPGTPAKPAKAANDGTGFSRISRFSSTAPAQSEWRREQFEERAAILEFCGGQSRADAERDAAAELME